MVDKLNCSELGGLEFHTVWWDKGQWVVQLLDQGWDQLLDEL